MEITSTPPPQPRQTAIRAAAENLEAAFLSEMMKSAGLGAMEGAFAGGAGEDQFASLMRQEQARMMVEGGGIGLAEHLVRSMSVAP
ncbi:flagellar rod assembly protein/muramidase FlgJ [Rhodobacteraceae bacterium THAF1]|uniref:rod-binding protein n=1 Tax=Palleronia sp. THAF1 TaxID=2587842 RepID=UPI000F3B2848|nr:rod-binding protein [Palleronia sp. THAF1]QFU10302.1 flagellar rod assembly protein/muramidase FlgJ [Palleronia sp. THAF1]VDC16793.1 flagellar rod assembly protein/muramidase FlgJ [Rhodobacteraceae bacterium THAF1]